MLRATIIVLDPNQMMQIYEHLCKHKNLNLVKIKNKMSTPLRNVTLNMIYSHNIIIEIQLQCGEKPINYGANHFLYELSRANTASEF